jgi:uncharacterized protein YukJ
MNTLMVLQRLRISTNIVVPNAGLPQRREEDCLPLQHGYGVVIGTFDHFERDPINDYGQYYHENLYVTAPDGLYHCAIDVDTKQTNDGIEWRVVPMSEPEMKGVAALADGWHLLASTDSSGALDNIRTAAFHRRGCAVIPIRYDPLFETLRQWFNMTNNPPWTAGTSIQALDALEPLLQQAQRLFVFGEPFTYGGLGVHNIHQNQGDPPGTQWWAENGVWQDGATIIHLNDGAYVAFLTKFKTQASATDANGHPAP